MSDLGSSSRARFSKFQQDLIALIRADADSDDEGDYKDELTAILVGLVEAVRDNEASGDPQFQDMLATADSLVNEAVEFWYEKMSEDGAFPTFSNKDGTSPLLKVPTVEGQFSNELLYAASFFADLPGFDRARFKALAKGPTPWKRTPQPHALSTPCARFQNPVPQSPPADKEMAASVFQARCEVSSAAITSPVDLALSPNGKIMALSGMGGWKDRQPFVACYFPNQENDTSEDFMEKFSFSPDLTSFITGLMIDEDRKLIFTADASRVKSYLWREPDSDGSSRRRKKITRVHTLDCSEDYSGPMAMLGGGSRILRAGKNKIAVWDIDSLPTHGEDGKGVVGKRMNVENTWRDDPEKIEASSGCAPSRTVDIDVVEGLNIARWHQHPGSSNVMICGSEERQAGRAFCHSFDVEAGGKPVMRYLGHGDAVLSFSTSHLGDPNVFLTTCNDGLARLYDVRHALPALNIVVGDLSQSPIYSAVLAHPDGIPFIFVGESRGEKITVWDVRAQKLVYELATGNNSVKSMAWDHTSNSLYAATVCEYVDRTGRHHDYRMARIPKKTQPTAEVQDEHEDEGHEMSDGSETLVEDDTEDEDEEWEDDEAGSDEDPAGEYEEQSPEVCWPKKAYHSENYFGHVFDAGEHTLYKFAFKPNPNVEVLPAYGCATLNSNSYW
ncbi:hypothetical protein D9613_007730 [Agrocybe pediades]|uniref:Uncharacterized protein n=1 Tax=Agrocybe pediades TaxID=84607 RepID=A0A8H4VL74_9AGAR|nr:hypothetical protein D9613_007730 [Agrocybe pediades]